MGAALAVALAEAQKWVGEVAGVVMVGLGDNTIDVWVNRDVTLPQTLHGVPVRVRHSGDIEAQ